MSFQQHPQETGLTLHICSPTELLVQLNIDLWLSQLCTCHCKTLYKWAGARELDKVSSGVLICHMRTSWCVPFLHLPFQHRRGREGLHFLQLWLSLVPAGPSLSVSVSLSIKFLLRDGIISVLLLLTWEFGCERLSPFFLYLGQKCLALYENHLVVIRCSI